MSYKRRTVQVLGRLIGANMNSTGDQALTLNTSRYVLDRIVATNASTSLTTAAGGLYTATSKGGTAIVGASQAYSALTGSAQTLDLTLATTDVQTEPDLWFSLTTPQGAPATADVYVIGIPLD